MLNRKTGLALIPLVLLLLSTSVAAASRNGVAPLPYQIIIPGGYFVWEPVDTVAATNTVSITVVSNVSISTAFMTNSQFSAFNNSNAEISIAQYFQNASTVQHTLQVPQGDYFLVFFAPAGNANVSYNYVVYPNSPFQSGPLVSPQPSGLASFGLYNDSGVVTPYTVETSEVVGVASITALKAYNATAASANASETDAGLQLNTVLVVNETGGNQQVYWIQNTPTFDTGYSLLAYGDNVWNFSVSGFLSNSTITSNVAYAYSYVQDGLTQYYYSYDDSNMTYALPLGLALLINETAIPGQGVLVQMGAQIFGNGSETATPANWFDNITIHDPTVQSAYFEVAGNDTTPDGTFYDTELVYGGEDNGEATSFTSLGSTLGLFYDNASTEQLTSFPSYYSFGQDTAESADNLQVSFDGNGFAQVSAGTPNYAYLGRGSGSFSLTQVYALASSVTATSSASASSPSSQSSTSSAPTTSSSSSSISYSYLPIAAVTTIVILSGFVWLRLAEKANRRTSLA